MVGWIDILLDTLAGRYIDRKLDRDRENWSQMIDG